MSFQLPLFEPASEWRAPSMSDLPTSWGSGRVGIDTENRDEHLKTLGPGVRRGAYIAGISFAIEDGPGFYLPIRHGGGGNMNPRAVISYLRDCAARFDGQLIGMNLGYDLDFLAEEGIVFPNVKWFRDIGVAAPLINELHNSYSMEAIAAREGIPGKDETLLDEALAAYGYTGSNKKGGIWALRASQVGPYGEQDARLPLTILRRQEREIEEQGLWDVWNLESRVLPVLIRMRRLGVAVSTDRLAQVEDWSRKEQQAAIEAANRHTKRQLGFGDITKPAALASVLREIGVDLPKTATGKDSVTASLLEHLNHPIGDFLRRAKKMSTLRSTFCDGVKKHLTNGRAHCTFNQMRRQKDEGSEETEGAAYGRLSSSNFNFQNQPARDPEIGPMWRSIYIPDTGKLWASLDYSQQEPRHAVEEAVKAGPKAIGEAAWEAAKEAANRYINDPSTDFHDMMTAMVKGDDFRASVSKKDFDQARKGCKQIYLGLSYGMGGAKLCHGLGLPTVWRVSWKEGRQRRFKDYENRDEAMQKMHAGKRAGYDTRCWEAAGAEGQALMDTFDRRVPFVRKMAAYSQEQAGKLGYTVTLSGRRCHYPIDANGNYDWLHKAFNRRIQGSSADQTKEAVVAMDAAGFALQLQVHDEVDLSVIDRDEAERCAAIMRDVIPMMVPMKVDIEIGPSWGEAK